MSDPANVTEQDRRWLIEAIELSRNCPPSNTAFSVGAIVVGAEGRVLATGYSREGEPYDHAEETALRKIGVAASDLATATIYSSLEPCSARKSRPRTCTELIIAAGIRRVVFAWQEPDLFVNCVGAATLREAGAEVVEMPELADLVRDLNAHLFASGAGDDKRSPS